MTKITTPNWFTNMFSKDLSVGEENQFTSTRGLRYGPLRINKTGIFVNNGSLDSTILNSSGFHGYGLTGTEQITLDASTGVNVTDGTSSVFKAEISGANVGDVTMGAYSTGAGVFYDKSAGTFTIKGTLSAGSLSIGTSPNWFNVDSSGNMWSGHANYASAPFRVSNGGTLVATSATITGAITATSGSFTGAVYASSGSFAGSITSTSGTIGGWTIGATSLSTSGVALSTAGGGYIGLTNGTSSLILESNNNPPYIAFTLSGSLKGTLLPTSAGTGGIRLLDGDLVLNNNKSVLINDTTGGGSLYGGMSITNGNQFWLTTGTGDTFYLKNNAQDTNLFTVSKANGGYFRSGDSSGDGLQVDGNLNCFDIKLTSGKDRLVFKDSGGNERLSFKLDASPNTKITLNGSDKTAIVKTSKGFKALYCAESPEVWFFDFCDTKKKIDPLFLEVTEGDMRFIKCDKGYQVWRRRKGHIKRFEPKTALQFYKNEAFLQMAKV